MGLILHEIPPSPPVRAVKLCINQLGLKVDYKSVNLLEKQHLTPEFIAKNPQHTVPTLEDGDFIVWDSHAINGYLVSKYAADDSLYPKDPQTRALIDQRLHFDTGVLFTALRNVGRKLFYTNEPIVEQDKQAIRDGLAFVEKFLEGRKFITGDSFNIADFSIYTSTTSLQLIVPEQQNYPNIQKYLALCRSSFKGIEEDDGGYNAFKELFASKQNV